MEELREALQAGWVNIIFEKLSTGTLRNTTATTRLDFIPTEKHPKNEKPTWHKDNYVRFFDLTVNNWRCLRFDTIQSWESNEFLNNLTR